METNHTAWVEVDVEAIRHNYRAIQAFVGEKVAVMAVVKSNAYGHGLELVADALKDEAAWYGVSTVDEGIRVRCAHVETPTLVFHPVNIWNAADIVANNLTATVDSEAGANALADAGRSAGVLPKAHIKVDTGMRRFGVAHNDPAWFQLFIRCEDIQWTGVYTHLATAGDKNRQPAQLQSDRLGRFLASMKWDTQPPSGVERHILNSSGLLRFTEKEQRLDMVRAGTLLYGQYPSPHVPHPLDLKPTWAFKTRIVSLRRIEKGDAVGYGAEWRAGRPSTIATIPVGYYDGFTVEPRSVWQRQGGLKGLAKRLSGNDAVMVKTPHGPAPVVGRVAAQSAMLDVTDLPNAAVGDTVDVSARRVLVGEHIPRVKV